MAECLRVEGLVMGYDRVPVLHGVSLNIEQGELVGIVGHNGAGKTTLLKTLIGLLNPWEGSISFWGKQTGGREIAANVREGMALVPQEKAVFGALTVAENLRAVRQVQASSGDRGGRDVDVLELFPVLKERLSQRAGTLSGGEQRMLAISISLLLKPRLLLLDEPSLGLAPVLVDRVMDTIARIRSEFGTTILLVEQNLEQVFRVSDRLYAIRQGQVVFDGRAEQLRSSSELWAIS